MSRIALYYRPGDPWNELGKIPEDLEQPTASAELVAVLLTMQMMAPEILLRLKSSCDVILKAMTKDPKTNEDRGWSGVKNRKTMKALAATLSTESKDCHRSHEQKQERLCRSLGAGLIHMS